MKSVMRISLFVVICTACSALADAMSVDVGQLKWTLSPETTREGNVVTVRAGDHARFAFARAVLDLKPYAGKALAFSIRGRGEKVGGEKSSLGFKFQLCYRDEETDTLYYPEIHGVGGTFPERAFSFTADFSNGRATQGWLTLGIQNAGGTAVYDLSSLRIEVKPGAYPRVTNGSYKQVYTDRVKNLPRLRGVMLPSVKIEERDFADLKAWGATLARYQMTGYHPAEKDRTDLAAYDRWLAGQLDRFERDVLPWGRRYGIRLVLDLHNTPGGRLPNIRGESAFCHDSALADHFVACWERIARRFKGNEDIILGYDLVNEPQQTVKAAVDYFGIQRRAAEAVRRIDPVTPIIIESNMMDSPDWFARLPALELTDVIYQVHMYVPGNFTHQGVSGVCGGPARPIYPDPPGWSRETLARTLKGVRAFQQAHGARIYVGEFSAMCYADGADRYLADCISLFEESGWDWTYHAFREYSGWSVEHVNFDKQPRRFDPAPENPRKDVLLAGFRGEDPRPLAPVRAGYVWQTDDWTLTVRDARTNAVFQIARPDFVTVKDEPMTLKTKDPAVYPWNRAKNDPNPLYWGWVAGTRLNAIKAFECTTRSALVPESLKVKKVDGTPLEEGRDFESERTWGTVARLAGGRIGSDETVHVDYVYAKQRIDRIVKLPDGSFALRRGTPAASYPIPPSIGPGEESVATVWTDAQTKKLADRNLFPTYETSCAMPVFKSGDTPAEKLLPKTLAKLRAGGKVRVLAWGDSVTNGGYLPEPERWQFQFIERLRARYPKAEIELVSCGWGGRSSASFRSLQQAPAGVNHPYNYREKVLGAKADLCVMEFVNDCGMNREAVFKAYGEILDDFRAQGTEWCVLTPHYTRADWMGLPSQKYCDRDPRPYVWAVRAFCAEKGVALADASRIWGRLWRQGIPYKTLLVNDINHPNAQGMGYFADALMAIFP